VKWQSPISSKEKLQDGFMGVNSYTHGQEQSGGAEYLLPLLAGVADKRPTLPVVSLGVITAQAVYE